MNKRTLGILLYILPVPLILVSIFIGPSQSINVRDILDSLFSFISFFSGKAGLNTDPALLKAVVIDVRLPRILLTFIIGGSLAASGCSLQAVFRNPLADPYILGLSSGSAFGAALAIAYHFLPVNVSAFFFGFVAVSLSYFIARNNRNVSTVSLILAGIIVTGIFTALLTIVQFLSDPMRLQTIVHWTMGNLHNAGWVKLKSSVIPMLCGVFVLTLYGFRMNLLALGDEEAKTTGINPDKDRIIILLAATLATSSAVSVAGVIGLYGLILPHMIRMMVGPDNRQAVPFNFLMGGMFLVVIDNFSRTIAGIEIPVGVFTILLGAPFFIFLMKKTSNGWN